MAHCFALTELPPRPSFCCSTHLLQVLVCPMLPPPTCCLPSPTSPRPAPPRPAPPPQLLLSSVALRRTKDLQVNGRPLVALPPKTVRANSGPAYFILHACCPSSLRSSRPCATSARLAFRRRNYLLRSPSACVAPSGYCAWRGAVLDKAGRIFPFRSCSGAPRARHAEPRGARQVRAVGDGG